MSDVTRELSDRLDEALSTGGKLISRAQDLRALEEARVRVLGRKAHMGRARAMLGGLAEADSRSFGRRANEVQTQLETELLQWREAIQEHVSRLRW